MLSFTVGPSDHCRQVESLLNNLMPGATRGYMQKLVRSGHVLLNGEETAPEQLLKINDTLTLKESKRTAALVSQSQTSVTTTAARVPHVLSYEPKLAL